MFARYALSLLALAAAASGCRTPSTAALRATSPEAVCPWSAGATPAETIALISAKRHFSPDLMRKDVLFNTKNVTRADAAADLACVRLILESYSGTPVFRDTVGVDLLARLDEAAATLPATMTRSELLDRMIGVHKGTFDEHMSYDYYSVPFYYQNLADQKVPESEIYGKSARLSAPLFYFIPMSFERSGDLFIGKRPDGSTVSVKSCERMGSVTALADDGITTYTALAGHLPYISPSPLETEVACIDAAGAPIKLPLAFKHSELAENSHTADGFTAQTLPGGIELLRIDTFGTSITDAQEAYANALATRDVPMIIDLRQQGGGGDPFNSALQQSFFTPEQKFKTSDQKKTWSLINVAGALKAYDHEVDEALVRPLKETETRAGIVAKAQGPVDAWRAQLDGITAAFNLKSLKDRVVDEEENFTGGSRPVAYSKPIVILIDKGCGSQCEFFVADLRHHPKVKIIGVPTGGRLDFGSNLFFDLPLTGIRMVSSMASTIHAPAAIEGEGIAPDLYVFGKDSVAVATAMVKKMMTEVAP